MSQTPVTEGEGGASTTFDLEEWNAYKIKHNKNYTTEEEEKMRIKIFLETKEIIAKHNADYEKGLTTFKMGINHLADLTAIRMNTSKIFARRSSNNCVRGERKPNDVHDMVPFRLDNITRFSIVFTIYITSGLTLPYMIVFYMMSK